MRSSATRVYWTVALTIGLTGFGSAAENWPQFRGPTMNATVADNPNLPEQWSQTENIEWVTEVPGLGWSSPVVWGDRIFITTATAGRRFRATQARPLRAAWT